MRDRGDQVPPRGLLGPQARDHRVGFGGQFGELVHGLGPDAHVALTAADGIQPGAKGVDVSEDSPGQELGREHGEGAGRGDDQGQERRVPARDHHQQGHDDQRHQHRRDHERHRDRELAGQRAGGDANPADHGRKRYPTPHTVWMCCGRAGSASTLARRRRMCTVTVEVSV